MWCCATVFKGKKEGWKEGSSQVYSFCGGTNTDTRVVLKEPQSAHL